MIINILEISIYIPWATSLKEKRREIKSIIQKVKNKFNVSIIETNAQDVHQIIMLGVVFATQNQKQTDKYFDSIISYLDTLTEGDVKIIKKEII